MLLTLSNICLSNQVAASRITVAVFAASCAAAILILEPLGRAHDRDNRPVGREGLRPRRTGGVHSAKPLLLPSRKADAARSARFAAEHRDRLARRPELYASVHR